MGTPIEAINMNQKPDSIRHHEVICIFCGLPTPVPESDPTQFECYFPRQISIIRCELCGKEATYLASDIVESGVTCRARHSWFKRN